MQAALGLPFKRKTRALRQLARLGQENDRSEGPLTRGWAHHSRTHAAASRPRLGSRDLRWGLQGAVLILQVRDVKLIFTGGHSASRLS